MGLLAAIRTVAVQAEFGSFYKDFLRDPVFATTSIVVFFRSWYLLFLQVTTPHFLRTSYQANNYFLLIRC